MTTVTALTLVELFAQIKTMPWRMSIKQHKRGWMATLIWTDVPNRGQA